MELECSAAVGGAAVWHSSAVAGQQQLDHVLTRGLLARLGWGCDVSTAPGNVLQISWRSSGDGRSACRGPGLGIFQASCCHMVAPVRHSEVQKIRT